MKNIKKYVSLLLTLLLLLSVIAIPVSVSAATTTVTIDSGASAGTYTIETNGTEATIIKYEGSTANLEIPSTLGGYTVTGIEFKEDDYTYTYTGFYNINSLVSVVIPYTVTSIGNFAFDYCENLQSVTIGDGVTSIGDYAFSSCCNLGNITFGNSVQTIGCEAFSWCTTDYSSNVEITLPASVTYIGDSAFGYCSQLTSVTIPNKNATIYDSYVFYGCASGLKVYGPSDATWIDVVEDMFKKMPAPISTVTIDSGASAGTYTIETNGTEATIIKYEGSTANLVIPSTLDDYTVTGIEYKEDDDTYTYTGFYNIDSIISVDIPDTVTSIGYAAFWSCYNLQSVTIGNNVTSIGRGAFSNCSNIESLTFGSGVTSIAGGAFSGCSSLETVAFPKSVTSLEGGSFYDCDNLKDVYFYGKTTNINEYAFSNYSNLTFYGYDASTAESLAETKGIAFALLVKTNTGSGYADNPLTATQSKDNDDTSFNLAQNSFDNIELLGVQRKAGADTHDMRFVAVINEGIIQSVLDNGDIADYGFVAAKTTYTSTASASENYISQVELDAENTFKLSCVGTENSFCGKYGTMSTSTKYKYVTLSIKDVPDDLGFVARFYIKTKSGKVYYANYGANNTGCVTSYSNLTSSIA